MGKTANDAAARSKYEFVNKSVLTPLLDTASARLINITAQGAKAETDLDTYQNSELLKQLGVDSVLASMMQNLTLQTENVTSTLADGKTLSVSVHAQAQQLIKNLPKQHKRLNKKTTKAFEKIMKKAEKNDRKIVKQYNKKDIKFFRKGV